MEKNQFRQTMKHRAKTGPEIPAVALVWKAVWRAAGSLLRELGNHAARAEELLQEEPALRGCSLRQPRHNVGPYAQPL